MAIQLQRGERDLQRIVDAIIQLVGGRQNSVGDVTLRDGQTTTTVTFPNCSSECRVFLFPQTANAAAALATTYILKANITRGAFTITHANNAQTDKEFSFVCIGG
jgi:hypothetical protein